MHMEFLRYQIYRSTYIRRKLFEEDPNNYIRHKKVHKSSILRVMFAIRYITNVAKRWDGGSWQFLRYLKVKKSSNPLCFIISFSQRAASPCNAKIACFVKKFVLHIYTNIELARYNAHCACMCKSEPKSYSSFLLELPC